nr:T-cell surface glycoprotein CD8 alpha chain isoform X1 [Pogona vitticeps]
MTCAKRENMAKNPSFLWFSGLILCCFLFQEISMETSMEISMISTAPVALNTAVELKCINKKHDTGVYWFLQKKDYTTHFILYISVLSKISGNARGYQTSKNGDYYKLTITSFKEEHQGIYYCLSFRNQGLYFSSGLQVYLPERTTKPPTVPVQVPTHSKGKDMGYPVPPTTEIFESTEFPCEVYIWAPLAGGCFLLLILLLITLSVCCDPRRRRRRCKCKRPMNGTNGVHPLPRKGM